MLSFQPAGQRREKVQILRYSDAEDGNGLTVRKWEVALMIRAGVERAAPENSDQQVRQRMTAGYVFTVPRSAVNGLRPDDRLRYAGVTCRIDGFGEGNCSGRWVKILVSAVEDNS